MFRKWERVVVGFSGRDKIYDIFLVAHWGKSENENCWAWIISTHCTAAPHYILRNVLFASKMLSECGHNQYESEISSMTSSTRRENEFLMDRSAHIIYIIFLSPRCDKHSIYGPAKKLSSRRGIISWHCASLCNFVVKLFLLLIAAACCTLTLVPVGHLARLSCREYQISSHIFAACSLSHFQSYFSSDDMRRSKKKKWMWVSEEQNILAVKFSSEEAAVERELHNTTTNPFSIHKASDVENTTLSATRIQLTWSFLDKTCELNLPSPRLSSISRMMLFWPVSVSHNFP